MQPYLAVHMEADGLLRSVGVGGVSGPFSLLFKIFALTQPWVLPLFLGLL